MSMNYPTIDIEQIHALLTVVEAAAADATYLNPENCPYDRDTVALIQKTVTACQLNALSNEKVEAEEKRPVGRPRKAQLEDMNELDKELDELRQELRQMKIDGRTLETSDKIQIFKVRASIIERMLTMKERITNASQVMKFITTVIGIMQDNLDDASRDKVMKELKKFADGER